MADPSDGEIRLARERGSEVLAGPRAVAARYLAERGRFEIDLASGWSVQVSTRLLGAYGESNARAVLGSRSPMTVWD